MTRIKSPTAVHFRNLADVRMTLCGSPAGELVSDLFGGEYTPWPETTERVTCTACARVVCAIRNEPHNTLVSDITHDVLCRGINAAVLPDSETDSHA